MLLRRSTTSLRTGFFTKVNLFFTISDKLAILRIHLVRVSLQYFRCLLNLFLLGRGGGYPLHIATLSNDLLILTENAMTVDKSGYCDMSEASRPQARISTLVHEDCALLQIVQEHSCVC